MQNRACTPIAVSQVCVDEVGAQFCRYERADVTWFKCKLWTADIYSLMEQVWWCDHGTGCMISPVYKRKKHKHHARSSRASTRPDTKKPSDEIVETHPTATGQPCKTRNSASDKTEPVVPKTRRSGQIMKLIIRSSYTRNCIKMVWTSWPKKQKRFVSSFLRGFIVFARARTIHNVVIAIHITERLALKFAIGERLPAKVYEM